MGLFMGSYISSSTVSFFYNVVLSQKNHKKAYNEAKRSIKYRTGLSHESKSILRQIRYEQLYDLWDGVWHSFVPISNVLYTYDAIMYNEELFDITSNFYKEIIDMVNKNEEANRELNIRMLKDFKENYDIPFTEEEMNNKELMNDKVVKKVLKHNGISLKKEKEKYSSKEN